MLESTVAAVMSLTIGVLGTRYADYLFWRRWARSAFAIAMTALCAVYMLAGLLGYLALTGAVAAEGAGAATAAAGGLAGQVALRAQLGRVAPVAEHSRSMLTLINGWIVELLDLRARNAVEQYVTHRDDAHLIELTFALFWRDFGGPDEGATAQLHALLKLAAEELGGAEAAQRADARGRLRGFCCREIGRARIVVEEER